MAPFTNLACRQAVEYAANHLTLQNAYGGPVAGGAIGSTVLPPTVAGYQKFDLYEATTKTQGDPAKAKQMLSAVGIKTTLHGFPTASYFNTFAGVPKYMSSHNIGIAFGGWGADWPDGYGFLDELVAGNTIVPAGNTNIGMLNDPVVNNLFTKAAGITDATQRNAIWGQIDQQVMKDAVIVPIVYAKALIYRPPTLSNVYFNQAYQADNYAVMGLTG